MGRAMSLFPQPCTAVLSSPCSVEALGDKAWLPRVDGIEVEVAIGPVGGEGKTHRGQNVFLLFFSFFVPKPTARVLYF